MQSNALRGTGYDHASETGPWWNWQAGGIWQFSVVPPELGGDWVTGLADQGDVGKLLTIVSAGDMLLRVPVRECARAIGRRLAKVKCHCNGTVMVAISGALLASLREVAVT